MGGGLGRSDEQTTQETKHEYEASKMAEECDVYDIQESLYYLVTTQHHPALIGREGWAFVP